MARKAAEKRGRELLASVDGTLLERYSIVGLVLAIETGDVSQQLVKLSANEKTNFLMAYSCCMIWAIKNGISLVVNQEVVQATVVAMHRYLSKNNRFQQEALAKIWSRTEQMMLIAFNTDPNAPPPYPIAQMLMAATQAGYPINMSVGIDIRFGIHMLVMMKHLSETAQMAANEHLERG